MLAALFTGAFGQNVCPCARNYMPVCGSNGRTYPNKCVFDCDANSQMGRSIKLKMIANSGCEDMENADPTADISPDDN